MHLSRGKPISKPGFNPTVQNKLTVAEVIRIISHQTNLDFLQIITFSKCEFPIISKAPNTNIDRFKQGTVLDRKRAISRVRSALFPSGMVMYQCERITPDLKSVERRKGLQTELCNVYKTGRSDRKIVETLVVIPAHFSELISHTIADDEISHSIPNYR